MRLLWAALWATGALLIGFGLGYWYASTTLQPFDMRMEGNAVIVLDRRTGRTTAKTPQEIHDATPR